MRIEEIYPGLAIDCEEVVSVAVAAVPTEDSDSGTGAVAINLRNAQPITITGLKDPYEVQETLTKIINESIVQTMKEFREDFNDKMKETGKVTITASIPSPNKESLGGISEVLLQEPVKDSPEYGDMKYD